MTLHRENTRRARAIRDELTAYGVELLFAVGVQETPDGPIVVVTRNEEDGPDFIIELLRVALDKLEAERDG